MINTYLFYYEGIDNFESIEFYTATKKEAIELYINDDKELFKGLYSHKDDVESAMGLALDWRELPERKASRIIVEKDVKFDD